MGKTNPWIKLRVKWLIKAVILIQDEDLDVISDSGISAVERQLADNEEESQRSVEHNVSDREGIISPRDDRVRLL